MKNEIDKDPDFFKPKTESVLDDAKPGYFLDNAPKVDPFPDLGPVKQRNSTYKKQSSWRDQPIARKRISLEARARISASLKGKKKSPTHIANLSKAMKGNRHAASNDDPIKRAQSEKRRSEAQKRRWKSFNEAVPPATTIADTKEKK